MTTLTDAVARSAKPQDGRDEVVIWDAKTPGFGLRVRSSGSRSWIWVRRDAKKRVTRYTIGRAETMRAAAARVIAERRNAERDAARNGVSDELLDRSVRGREPAAGPTVGEFIDPWFEYLKREGRRKKTLHEYRRHILESLSGLAKMPADSVKRSDITRALVALEQQSGSPTAKNARAALSSLYDWLVTTDRLGDLPSPLSGTYRPKGSKKRKRVLSLAELRAVWKAASGLRGGYGNIVKLLILTGQRRDEIGGLIAEEVDLEQRFLDLPEPRMKNHLQHLVPLSDQAFALLKPWSEAAGDGPLFGRGKGGFQGWSKSFKRFVPLVQAEFGRPMKRWIIHDLRRTFSTTAYNKKLADGDVIELYISHVSGKSRQGVAGTYNHAELLEQRQKFAQDYADWLMSVVEG